MQTRRHLRILTSILAFVLVQGLAVLGYRWVERHRNGARNAGFPYERLSSAPALGLVLLRPNGTRRTLAELRGQPVLLHFWATWCPPCRAELPGLLELGHELQRAGELQLVALSVDSDWAAVREFFGGRLPPEVSRDAAGSAAAHYDVSTLPDTYLLDAAGSVRLRFNGTRDWRSELARDTLRKELALSPAATAKPRGSRASPGPVLKPRSAAPFSDRCRAASPP
jgi:thiol-disulfide isomerase/thioredoxin